MDGCPGWIYIHENNLPLFCSLKYLISREEGFGVPGHISLEIKPVNG